jgi:hypothetical protein
MGRPEHYCRRGHPLRRYGRAKSRCSRCDNLRQQAIRRIANPELDAEAPHEPVTDAYLMAFDYWLEHRTPEARDFARALAPRPAGPKRKPAFFFDRDIVPLLDLLDE